METRENYDALFQESPQAAAPAPSEPRAPMDKEAWAAKQKEQRETLYERADRMADAVLDDPRRFATVFESAGSFRQERRHQHLASHGAMPRRYPCPFL